MKKILVGLTFILALGTALACMAQAQEEAKANEIRAAGKEVLNMLIKEDFAKVVKKFDGKMLEAMPQANLREAWVSATASIGAFKTHGDGQIKSANGYDFITIKCQYEQALLYVRIAFNNEKKVSGLQFRAEAD
jgi:hypothetical protein